MNFDTECRNILLFEFSGEMSLDERGLEMMLAIARVLLVKDEKIKRIFQLIAKAIAITLFGGLR